MTDTDRRTARRPRAKLPYNQKDVDFLRAIVDEMIEDRQTWIHAGEVVDRLAAALQPPR